MKISYGLTVCNEHVEIKNLIEYLIKKIDLGDEIVVVYDQNRVTPEVMEVLKDYEIEVNSYPFDFQQNFLENKNFMNSKCTGDYIFQIDADEIPNDNLIESLPSILKNNADVILTPRINIVEGITPQHIQMWGWKQNDKGWVQFPDYQWRIFRNTPDIKWINKLHEVLDGYKTYAYLPEFEEYSLYHYKHISKQESQNNFYSRL